MLVLAATAVASAKFDFDGCSQPAFSWNWGWNCEEAVAAAIEPKEVALPPPVLCAPQLCVPPQPPVSALPVGPLSLNVPLAWSLPPPSVVQFFPPPTPCMSACHAMYSVFGD